MTLVNGLVQVEESSGFPPQMVFGIHTKPFVALTPITIVIRVDDAREMVLRGIPLDAKLSEEGFLILWQRPLHGI